MVDDIFTRKSAFILLALGLDEAETLPGFHAASVWSRIT